MSFIQQQIIIYYLFHQDPFFRLIEPTQQQLDLCISQLDEDDTINPSPAFERIRFVLELEVNPEITIELSVSLSWTSSAVVLSAGSASITKNTQLLLSAMIHEMNESSMKLMEGDDYDILDSMDRIKSFVLATVVDDEQRRSVSAVGVSNDSVVLGARAEETVRVWYWLVSLSTKEKRNDLVNWAPEYGLTGFVLAGKPGIVCVEGVSSEIDRYLAEIKSVSWSDVPSFQKKITERHRELVSTRAFSRMEEITGSIDQGGKRGNRGEMSQVKDFMRSKGVEGVFDIVLGIG